MSDTDEISVTDIVHKLWLRRGFILAVVVFATIAGMSVAALMMLRVVNPVVYYVSLTGIENGRYPNGSTFAPTDLLLPDVVAAIADKWRIADRQELREAFAVRYGSPFEQSVHAKFGVSLAKRDLSAAEIDTINAAYAEELRQVIQSGLRIELDFRRVGLDAGTGASVVAALPEFWKEIFPRRFKVFTDTRLQSVSVPRGAVALENSASIVLADAAVHNMRYGLRLISEDGRLSSVMTGSGRTASDLEEMLDRFVTEYFNPLITSIPTEQGPVSETYIREIELDIGERQRRLTGLDEAITVLKEFQNFGSAASSGPSTGGIEGGGVQLGESAFGQIVDLAKQATLAEHIRDTLRERQELVSELAQFERQLALVKTPVTNILDKPFRLAASERFDMLLTEYEELLAAARARIEERAGALFTPSSSPVVIGSMVSPAHILVVLICGAIGVVAAGTAALLMPIKRRGRSLVRTGGSTGVPFVLGLRKRGAPMTEAAG